LDMCLLFSPVYDAHAVMAIINTLKSLEGAQL
jgi:hypothetical protein